MIDELVEFYGERWRPLIASALAFLDAHEPAWGVTLDRWEYIADLLANAKGYRH